MVSKDQLHKLASGFEDEIIAYRRYLHQNPELSFEEKNTSSYIRTLLDKWKIQYDYPYAGHGFLARIEGGLGPGKTIALRTDMDALPINEASGVEFQSENKGIMHACGHDMHMASMLGCIRILNELKGDIRGNILFIFQPGEEKLPGGAKLMLEQGLFENAKPDYIIAQHVLPEMPAGSVGFCPGEYMASSDEIYIDVKGIGGHGALTEKLTDPVLISAHILIGLQQEINRKAPKGTPTVLSFGKLIANGAVNVIPDNVKIEGTFRTMNEDWRKKAHKIIRQVAQGIASGFNGKVDVEIRNGYPVLYNNPDLTKIARQFAIEYFGNKKVIDMGFRMTAEDFAWYSHAYPSLLYRFGVGETGSKKTYPLHTDKFKASEKSLITGMSGISWICLNLLKEASIEVT